MAESTAQAQKCLLPDIPVSGDTVLALGRSGTDDALERLRQFSPVQLSNAILELAPRQRVDFLELSERIDEIIPLLPEAEFIRTLRGYGIEESGWLIEFASPEQRVAAVDLDCWRDGRFSPSRFFEWVDAMIEAGPETLVASFFEIDIEVWVLAMRAMGDFDVLGIGTNDPNGDGDSLCGGTTIDGLVYHDAHTADDEDRIREILTTAFQFAPSFYWSLVYGASSRSDPEADEHALRWHRNRLTDLGFPEREQSMRAYRPLDLDAVPISNIERSDRSASVVTRPGDAPALIGENLLGRSLAELSAERGREVMGSILSLANALAVADRLPLMADTTAERSLAKAVRGVERGLIEVSRARNRSLGAMLDTVPALDLFRIGATLDASLHPESAFEDPMIQQEQEDWNVETESLIEEDEII